ncbi:MAG TPA: MFS transporter, partial [Solirubrobacteraceae bacterium]|nr:MFS transporter [Solirubrobacteraceae bacterium]
CALAAGLWNLRVLPRGPLAPATSDALPRASLSWLVTRTSLPLLSAALIVGFGTSVYWTFAVDMIVTEGGLADASGQLFLVLLGLAGVLGGTAGALLHRFGARWSTWVTLLGLVVSLCLLPAVPSSWPAIATSAVLFGGSYFVLTAVFAVWSVRVFPDRPSAGFGATFFVLSAGQLVGPVLGGAIAESSSLQTAFYVGAALTLLSFPFAPRERMDEREPEPVGAVA